ncbi:MAG: hypothetical protein R2809_01130 [Flavobacteriales bacterium]
MKVWLLTLIGGFISVLSFGQSDTTTIKLIRVEGKIREQFNQPISNVIVINQSTKTGTFGKSDGSFVISCQKSDTLVITSLGYYSRTICFSDSVKRDVYHPIVFLEERIQSLAVVEVFAPRDLEKIQKDIEALGYNEKDYMLSGINALSSPITFLYQQFSRVEESKREVKRLENEDRKRDLLKELFQHYVDYDIIQLSDEDFDDFIFYLNVSDDFLKNSSQYDFLIFVRDRIKDYKINKRNNVKINEEDYNFSND